MSVGMHFLALACGMAICASWGAALKLMSRHPMRVEIALLSILAVCGAYFIGRVFFVIMGVGQ